MTVTLLQARKWIAVFMLVLMGAIVGLAGRIAWVQIVEGPQLAEKARNQLQESRLLQTPRGTIYDRNGRELAISSLTKSLYVNHDLLNKDPGELAAKLAPILGMPVDGLRDKLKTTGSFVWIKRKLEPQVVAKVNALIKDQNIAGLDFEEESKRYYPNNRLAAQVLGFVGMDDTGLDGMEMVLDKTIKGVLSRQAMDTDNRGIPIFQSVRLFNPEQQKKSVSLTIDSTIQFIVEKSLDKAMAETKAKTATMIVMNTQTGDILAMASRPTYDPNQFTQFSESERRNRAVSINYEPGSTFKAIVAAAALQEKVVTADEKFVDTGFVEVSGRRIKNWNDGSFGTVTFADVVKNSINTGFAHVGLHLGAARLTQYAKAFGFGQPTDIELPGEESGLLLNPQSMGDSDVATMGIGQSIAVTPIQLITAVNAIANNGVLLKPHIIREVDNADGSVDRVTVTEKIRQVISPETAKELTRLLEKVVSEGSGKLGAVKGYAFAGKTGTAEKLRISGEGYDAGHYIASFIGFGPVEEPQVIALVIIDDPEGTYYGGEIAAPVFSEVMSQVMRYLSIRPNSTQQMIPGYSVLNPSSTTSKDAPPVPKGKVLVPALAGRSIREAGGIITINGLMFTPFGSGVAVRQSIDANTAVDPGTEITVYFEQR